MSDLSNICNIAECTYSQTSNCILNNEPLTCPNRIQSIETENTIQDNNSLGDIVLKAPEESERFSSSFSITVEESRKLMQGRYCKIVGILGVPGTGKTASLASLYLLLATGSLKGFRFLDSKSIRAFEEIANGARRWNKSNLPDQLTVHTELQDERIAGFLHLKLEHLENGQKSDLLLTDLPGEWTTSLIEHNRIDRLEFLQSAERIWIAVNAVDIENVSTRHLTLHRTKLLIERLKAFLIENIPDICIVITHCDKSASIVHHFTPIKNLAEGFDIKIFEIASFSDNDKVAPGTGINILLEDLLQMRTIPKFDFTSTTTSNNGSRHILQFRNDE